ncbi:MAG: hypothetical protein ACK44Z_11785 [Pirellulaceae bacterium]
MSHIVMFRSTRWCLMAVMTLIPAAFGTVRAEDPPAASKMVLADGLLELQTPADWKVVPPKSNIIQYEFRAPKDAKEADQARVTVMSAGGGIQANIDRWKGQFELSEKEVVEKKEVSGQTLHLVDLKGTFKESMGGPFAGGAGGVKKMNNYRMLGVIIETKNAGTVFVKMTGPEAIVEKQKEAWLKMLDGMKATL